MTKDEMKNKISMALKDPILQQGFEIICKNLSELEKENKELKEKLTAVRNAKDKYDMSKDKSIINACGAEYTLFCDLERILEDWQEDDKLTEVKELLNEFMRISKASDEDFEHDYSELIAEAEQFIKE